MKLIYCHADVYNPGGMERVLLNKLRGWVERGYETMVVTTDQHGRPPFYEFPPEVRMVDLGINYKDDNDKNPIAKTLGYLRKRRKHRQALTELLMRERPDIVVSLFPSESSFIPDIQDGSLKMLELHFNKQFRLQYNRKGLLGLADRIRTKQDERLVRKFDNFIVLTRQDAEMWGDLPNLSVMPNAVVTAPHIEHKSDNHRVIAVGRLDYQKGFDRLLDAWALIPSELRKFWRLDIFGQGEWEEKLKQQIMTLGIGESAAVNQPTDRIFDEYAASDFLVMTSHYEGFPMVMIEAMACGVPTVCFDFLCGPRDIIANGINGITVPEGNLQALSTAMQQLMEHPEQLAHMSDQAKRISEEFSQEVIMRRWDLFMNDQLRKR
ncbi:MAG: glycosyltransferase family 4 protein [Bacteroidales bacterium]|nr:glycosyltransferase family 4 protein [Bacteroidales bacterium]